ncbi:MAG: hypothetical protein NVS3B10_00230 [Polyangiales bacterium]
MANGSAVNGQGLISESPHAIRREQPKPTLYDPFGRIVPDTNDPAWQPPRDPLAGVDPKASAAVIYREIPLTVVQTSWSVSQVRTALQALVQGNFTDPAQLCDAVIGDDRVQATMGSRTGGLLGCQVKHTPSKVPGVKDSEAAKACFDAWTSLWPTLATESSLSEMQRWAVTLGFGLAQILWDTSGELDVPYVVPFHPQYTYYHWTARRYVAITLDGQTPIVPGDGTWILHAPHGEYRGWMRGAIRALAAPWLIRAYTYRDWARYSERHGMPIILARTPAAGDPVQIQQFRAALAQLGQESLIQLPTGVDKQFGYDLDLLEATANTWEGFAQLIDRCEKSMTLAVLFQNLTTEVKEGSLAAARVHGDVRQSALEADERALSHTIYTQLARPFAWRNFGDADLAPVTHWDVKPPEDRVSESKIFVDFASAVLNLRRAGFKIENITELARTMGIRLSLGEPTETDPLGAASPAHSGFGAT